jgi:hypothetical protein
VPQQGARHRGQRRVPFRDNGRQLRHARGPLVGALQPQVVGLVGAADRVPLRADVDLLAPVDLAAGHLAAQLGIAAKVWTADHRDGVFVGLRQREQSSCRVQHPTGQRLGHVVSGQVEESDLVGHLAQVRPQLCGRVAQIHLR